MQHLACQCTLLSSALLLVCASELSASSEHLFLLLPNASATLCTLLPCGGRHSWHGPPTYLMSNLAAAISPSTRSGPDYLNPTLPTSRSAQQQPALELVYRTDISHPARSLAHFFEPLKVIDYTIPLLQQLEGLANKLLKLLAAPATSITTKITC